MISGNRPEGNALLALLQLLSLDLGPRGVPCHMEGHQQSPLCGGQLMKDEWQSNAEVLAAVCSRALCVLRGHKGNIMRSHWTQIQAYRQQQELGILRSTIHA